MPIEPKSNDIEQHASNDEFKHFRNVDSDVAHMGFDIKGELINEENIKKNNLAYSNNFQNGYNEHYSQTFENSYFINQNFNNPNMMYQNVSNNFNNCTPMTNKVNGKQLPLFPGPSQLHANYGANNLHELQNAKLSQTNRLPFNQSGFDNSINLFPFVHSSKNENAQNILHNSDYNSTSAFNANLINPVLNSYYSPNMLQNTYKNQYLIDLKSNNNNNGSNNNNNFSKEMNGQLIKKRPKKPLNAFMLYMKEMRPKIALESSLKESAAINRIIGKHWHELDKKEQSKYYELAKQERLKHRQNNADYEHSNVLFPRTLSTKKKIRRGKINGLLATKKCRARYGLEHQELWCRPCRRKKKCERYFKSLDTMDDSKIHKLASNSNTQQKYPINNQNDNLHSDSENNISNDSLIHEQEKNEAAIWQED